MRGMGTPFPRANFKYVDKLMKHALKKYVCHLEFLFKIF